MSNKSGDERLLENCFEFIDEFKDGYRWSDGKFHAEWKKSDETSFNLWRALGKRLGRDTKDGA